MPYDVDVIYAPRRGATETLRTTHCKTKAQIAEVVRAIVRRKDVVWWRVWTEREKADWQERHAAG